MLQLILANSDSDTTFYIMGCALRARFLRAYSIPMSQLLTLICRQSKKLKPKRMRSMVDRRTAVTIGNASATADRVHADGWLVNSGVQVGPETAIDESPVIPAIFIMLI